ncbi:MAG: DUF4091 domain-containing protein [Ruminococcaceae bacterium]|nr:DUF4091 domain-containing protein [Oscillospiraceae bacterium]
MKRYFKRIAFVFIMAMILGALNVFASASSVVSGDPADTYVPEIAPYEDEGLSLWFEHSFTKVLTRDTTPSGMDTYSAYMAKNEVENIQFVLCSDTTKAGMGAKVSDFTDENGNVISAELYYEMYVTVSGIRDEFVLGADASTTPIREGETPDPVYPLSKIGGKFQLNAGKSQAFFIKLRTDESTPSGWYSAKLDITDSSGNAVKCATVFCYVWDFTLSEKTALKTAVFLDNDTAYGGTYEKFYNYLLDNRIVAMDPPGGLSPSNPYLTNPRVNAVRVTYDGGGASGSYGEVGTFVEYDRYLDIYSDLSSSDIWDDVKDKFYFYTADEPVGAVWNKITGSKNMTVDDVKTFYGHLENYWEAPMAVVPYHENHPYPYFHYTSALGNYKDYELTDSTQAMIDQGGVSIWCPQFYAFTPQSELFAAGYKGMGGEPVRDLSASISGLYSYGSNNSATGTFGVDFFFGTDYYNWNGLFGEFSDRIQSEIALAKREGRVDNSVLWTYGAGGNYCYTYANHLIENTGLQTKMLFWQFYQNDVEGYLYYSSNGWREVDEMNGTDTVDNTVTGSFKACEWRTNKLVYNEDTFYGNGVLFYGASQARMRGVSDYVGTLRVELMRDGIEEYQMLTMLEDYLGEAAAKEVVSGVSTNVVRYLSLPGFDVSGWDSDMDADDIMASVRLDLGNALEAAVEEGKCDHEWDDGVVTEEAGCLTTGTTVYSCKSCDAKYDEVIPSLHSAGDCFTKVSGTAATCEQDGDEVYQCTYCGYKKGVKTTAFHNDKEYYRYGQNDEKTHGIYCTVCSEKVDVKEHICVTIDTATCTDGGEIADKCRFCDYVKSTGIVTEAKGHDFEDGVCTACGEKEYTEPEYTPGDVNGDGEVNAMDMNVAKRIIAGTITPTSEQVLAGDLSGDGAFNGVDSNYLARLISGTN